MTVRVALVGAGIIAQNAHLPAWYAEPRAEVAVVVDPDVGRAQAVADRWGIPHVAERLDAALAAHELDAVDLCLPPRAHLEALQTALDAGVHVLLEKPFVVNLEEARRALELEEAADSTVMVAENWPFSTAGRRVAELLNSGVLGDVFMVRAHHESGLYLPEAGNQVPPWQLDASEAGGGYLLNAGIHTISLARRLVGEFDSLTALSTADLAHDTSVDYDLALTGTIDARVVTAMNFTGRSRHLGERRLYFTMFGSDGLVEFDVLSGHVRWTAQGRCTAESTEDASMGFAEEIAHFLDCIESGARPITDSHDQIRTLATVIAAYRSVAERRPVSPGELLDGVEMVDAGDRSRRAPST